MIKGAFAVHMALIFCGIEAASAQSIEQRLHQVTEVWTNQTGEYVPSVVRQEYFKGISDQITAMVSRQVASTALASKGLNEAAAKAIVAEQNAFGKNANVSQQSQQERDLAALVENVTGTFATIQTVGLWLQRFPTIRVIVQPKPPREFLLTINGEPCPATEKAIYRVPAGAVTIRVWRQGSALCEKTYNTVAGAIYDVQCAF